MRWANLPTPAGGGVVLVKALGMSSPRAATLKQRFRQFFRPKRPNVAGVLQIVRGDPWLRGWGLGGRPGGLRR